MPTLCPIGGGRNRRLGAGFDDPHHQNEKTGPSPNVTPSGDGKPADLPNLYRSEADRLSQGAFTPKTSALVDWLLYMAEVRS